LNDSIPLVDFLLSDQHGPREIAKRIFAVVAADFEVPASTTSCEGCG